MPDPTPVEVVAPNPIPVIVAEDRRETSTAPTQNQRHDPSLPATTTFQEDLTFSSQRRVNLIWERTQAAIALMVVAVTMVGAFYGMVKNLQIPTILAVAFGTVVGFYFSRTNHAAIGGIGPKAESVYMGR